jgi:predicted phage terminase large subunit-like protein
MPAEPLDLVAARDELWRARLPYSPHVPTAAQARFLLRPEREVLYGGAAGGGKSDALLMAALQYVHVPRYAAIIFRRTFADLALPGAIMDRAKEWLVGRPGVRWNDNDKRFVFECAGGSSSLTFAYLEHEVDKYRYQGAEFQFIAFDELTQFTETAYRYLFSRCRRPKDVGEEPLARVPLRTRAASNPGGAGHTWVLGRFIDQARDEKGRVWTADTAADIDLMRSKVWIRDLASQDDEGKPVREDRAFVPAKLEDNPHLDQEEYGKSLRELDAVTRAQLRRGDWAVRPKGPLFDRTSFKVVDAVPVGCRFWRYWDLASTPEDEKKANDPDWTAGAKCAIAPDGTLYVADVRRAREDPAGVERLIKHTAEVDGKGVPVTIEQEPGSSGAHTVDHYQRTVLRGWSVYGEKKTGSKVELARPLSAYASNGHVCIVRGPWNGAFLDEAESFPFGGHDDQVDAVAGAYRMLSGDELVEHTTPDDRDVARGRLASPFPDEDDDEEMGRRRM